ncbi:MAG: sugar phosphate isomerase/epimerase, partial [Lachnospiraceae bacterium]|nr:sugar phosphate isomerase/epimerase [Lachnospiraceae bacterium]
LKIVFDVGHGNYLGKDPYTEVMHAGKELKHLHIHDNHGIGPEGPKDEHLPVGEGNIDYDGFAKGLLEVGYEGLYMMELHYCTEENLEQCRQRMLESIEKAGR